jgi:hypothetical protein
MGEINQSSENGLVRKFGALTQQALLAVGLLAAMLAVSCDDDDDDGTIYVYIKEGRFIEGAPPTPTPVSLAPVIVTNVTYAQQTYVAPVLVPFTVTWAPIEIPSLPAPAPVQVKSIIVELESLGGYFEVPVPDPSEPSGPLPTSVEFDMGFSPEPLGEETCTGNFNGPGIWCWAEAPPEITTSDVNFRAVAESGKIGVPDDKNISISWSPPPVSSGDDDDNGDDDDSKCPQTASDLGCCEIRMVGGFSAQTLGSPVPDGCACPPGTQLCGIDCLCLACADAC